jgi:glycosyltransferase involved in cell wall biosynthesis
MRVIFISHSTECSGAPFVLISIMQHLNAERFDPLAVFPDHGGAEELARSRGLKNVVIRNPQIALSETRGLWPKLTLLFKRIVYTGQLVKILRRERGAITYVNSAVSICPGLAAVLAGKRVCWHIHEDMTPTWLNHLKIWLIKRIARVIIFAGPSSQKMFLPRPRRARWFVVPNGIDVGRFAGARASAKLYSELDLTRGDPVVSTTALLSWRKGIDLILEAAAKVVSHVPNVRFLIVGETAHMPKAYLDSLYTLMERHQLARNVLFTGGRNDIPDILALSTIFILASRRETAPVSLVEAMAAGKPIIATDVGSISDMLDNGRCGMIVPPEDPAALGKAILQLLEDVPLRERLAHEAREKASREYRFDGFIQQIANAIACTVSK